MNDFGSWNWTLQERRNQANLPYLSSYQRTLWNGAWLSSTTWCLSCNVDSRLANNILDEDEPNFYAVKPLSQDVCAWLSGSLIRASYSPFGKAHSSDLLTSSCWKYVHQGLLLFPLYQAHGLAYYTEIFCFHIWCVGTDRIHGKKCMISRQNFQNVSNFTENSRKKFCKFTGNSQAPQMLFRGAVLLQTKKFQNNEYLLH